MRRERPNVKKGLHLLAGAMAQAYFTLNHMVQSFGGRCQGTLERWKGQS